ncbi:GntR family transcriptional regulator [Pseudonocardia endophytica]|uniref:GntR family transcriptional regulator n=1 Tax=Pseudonocardia endophytica TaxID=401976 RepID=A0A4R1HQ00_PSEEN|nr:GntR family transcriptional regulator [Pseudonocardia endophytica]TCK21829.1 GntR family transcriptional regulator [Pseudonocardia endophytica]
MAHPVTGDGAIHALSRAELLRVLNKQSGSSLVDEIIIKVGTDIIEGRIKPGDDLNSVELARTFNTSRTPVREALLTLQREGFVEIAAHRRPRVAPLSLSEVQDMYRVRAYLYEMVSHQVVDRATDRDLDALDEVQQRLEAAAATGDVDGYFWTNVEFRNTEAGLARNPTLVRVIDTMGLRMLRLRHLSLSMPGRLATSVEDHERLIRAYRDRDGKLAAAFSASLVMRGLTTIEGSGWVGIET